jgi:serine/threonine protein kinase
MEHYKVIQKLGDGVFGTCVKAMDTRTGALVAIKTFKSAVVESKCEEVKVLRKLDHINVVKLLEVLRTGGAFSIVLEYAECNLLTLYTQVKNQSRTFPQE